MTMEIGALGSLSVAWSGGTVVPLVPQTRPALLLALLVSGDAFSRTETEIASLLWPRAEEGEDDDDPERRAISNIGKPLHTLRAALKTGAPRDAPAIADVVLRGEGYVRLAPEHVRVDAFEFERRALALLDEAPSPARHERSAALIDALAPDFLPELRRERAASAIRDRLAALRRRLFDETFEALRAAGSDRATDLIERAFDATPADAAVAYRYVNVLTLERQSERAWRAYEKHAAAREALGLAPAPEVGRLLASFREPIVAFARHASASEIVGRDEVLAKLDDALAATRDGGGRIAIVAAEGRGRTRLLFEAVRRAREGGAFVGATRGLFGLAGDRVVRDLHRSLLAAQVAGRSGPRIEVRASGDALPGDVDSPLTELRLTIAKLTQEGKRVVLALDDPHFIDRPSLERIEYALERSGATFVTTARAALDRIPAAALRIDVGDLAPADERLAIDARLGTIFEPESEARLRALWPGNLALLLAVAVHADDATIAEAGDDGRLRLLDDVPDAQLLPEAISASFEVRLRALHQRAGIVAAAFAAGRAPRSLDELAAISGYEAADVERHVAKLMGAGLVLPLAGERWEMPPAVALVAARSISRERFAEFERRAARLERRPGHAEPASSERATNVSRIA